MHQQALCRQFDGAFDYSSDVFHAADWAATPMGPGAAWSPRLRMAVEFMLECRQPMFILWGESRTFLFNEAFCPILGPDAAKALGASLPVIWSEIWDRVGPLAADVFAGRAGLAENVPLLTWASNFEEMGYYTFSYTPLREGGQVAGAVCLCTDTTEKVLTAQALEQERNGLHELYQRAPGFIALTQGPEHRFTFANASYRQLVGHREIVGRTVADVLPEIAEQGFIDMLDRVYATGEPFEGRALPIRLQREPGREWELRYIDTIYHPVRGAKGEITGLFAEGHDVTERVLAREKVQALQTKLIHVSRVSAMGTMASTLAHELNQPLTAIANYAVASNRLLDAGPKGAEQLALGLRAINENALRAGDIVRRIRAMTVQDEVRKTRFAIEPVVREATALATSVCLSVVVDHDFEDDLMAVGDPVQVQQVMLNLIRNACEAVEHKEERIVTIRAARDGDMVEISVRDTGDGIAEEAFPSLFDSFYSTKPDGVGVGLSISRTIVEAHHGSIRALNDPQGGALFCFTLPVAEMD